VKALYALVFVLFSFAAPAQTLETWIAEYLLGELDCFAETTQQSTMPPPIIGIELLCAAILDDVDGVATTGFNAEEDVQVGAIQPSDENAIAAYSSRSDDRPTVDDTSAQSAMPTIDTLGAAKFNKADDVAITGPHGAEDVLIGAIPPSDEHSTAKYSTGRDDTLTIDDTIEQGAMPAQTIATEPTIERLGDAKVNEADDVAITGPKGAEGVPVGAIPPSDENSITAYLSRSNDHLTVDNTIAFIEDQSALHDEDQSALHDE
jgi:hypothetical protein